MRRVLLIKPLDCPVRLNRSSLCIAGGAVATALVATSVMLVAQWLIAPKSGWAERHRKNVESTLGTLRAMDSAPNSLAGDPAARVILGLRLKESLTLQDVESLIEAANAPVSESTDTLAQAMEPHRRRAYLERQGRFVAGLAGAVLAEYVAFGKVEGDARKLAVGYIQGLLAADAGPLRREGIVSAYEAGLLDQADVRAVVVGYSAGDDHEVAELARLKLKQWDTFRGQWLKARGLKDVGQPE